MANYYTKFSLVMSLPNQEALDYAMGLHSRARIANQDECLEPDDLPRDWWPSLENWHHQCEPDRSPSGFGLWIHSEEGGIDSACLFIQHLLAKYQPAECVEFQWSDDCSKPRLDAFGGGAAFITATEIRTFHTREWLDAQKQKQIAA